MANQSPYTIVANMTDPVNFPNLADWEEGFWKHFYLVHLTAQDIIFAVNASNEQDALDFVIDYCEEHMPGLVSEFELGDDSDSYVGGNHGLRLTTCNIRIEQLK